MENTVASHLDWSRLGRSWRVQRPKSDEMRVLAPRRSAHATVVLRVTKVTSRNNSSKIVLLLAWTSAHEEAYIHRPRGAAGVHLMAEVDGVRLGSNRGGRLVSR